MADLKSRLGILRSRAIYVWKPFSRHRLRRFYRQFVRPGSLCFDIGAHLGSRSRVFLDLGAQVIALEPQPACAAYLRKRWRGERKFTLIPKAIGAQAGNASLHINRMNPTISTLSPAGWRSAMAAAAIQRERWEDRVAVEVTTLDRLIEDYGMPDFCKIDVEGYEAQALAGLCQPIPALSFEFISFDAGGAKACLRRLTALGGYRFNWSLRERLRLESLERDSASRVETMIDRMGMAVGKGAIH